jgi:hypothetical protein
LSVSSQNDQDETACPLIATSQSPTCKGMDLRTSDTTTYVFTSASEVLRSPPTASLLASLPLLNGVLCPSPMLVSTFPPSKFLPTSPPFASMLSITPFLIAIASDT